MRAFCTVSAPLEVCASSAEQLSPGSRFLALRLLGNQQPKTLYFLVDAKSRVREVYTQTCLHFATQGMLDTELFGLAVLIDGEYMFADPESKLSKYGPKSWRSSHTHGLDANGRPLLELHFRVQFYIESPFILKDETSRHNYYLQLKYNVLHRDIPSREYSEQSMILLAGLALQADLGDAPLGTTTASLSASSSSSSAAAAAAVAAAKNHSPKADVDGGGGGGVCTVDGVVNDDIMPSSSAESVTRSAAKPTVKVAAATTTTLPKINKRMSSASERVLRLSTYAAATTPATVTTSASTSSSASSSVFPISGSLKRSLGAVAASLSSSSSLNRNATTTTASASVTAATSSSATATATTTAGDYFRLEDYLPAGLRTAWAASALRACHRENRGLSTADAELHYIQHACIVHESINAHTFRMRMTKNENGPGNTWFIVYAKGIKIFNGFGENALQQQQQQQQQQQTHQGQPQQITFLWPNITKLSFERKKFEIRSGESKIILFATSDDKNKMLLTLCKETHQFSMKIAARLKEVIKREEEENNCLHACYIYSRSLHLPYKNKNDQRISVISSTSSNTTSGIVSDRVHSEDELEIMINTPPVPIAAPSTESLALAHLLDHRPSVSRQTSSVGQVSLKDLEEQLAALSVRQAQKRHSNHSGSAGGCGGGGSGGTAGGGVIGGGESPTELSNTSSAGNSSSSGSNPTSSQRTADSSIATDSPSSQHNIGSQCSSTCSTVVVASPSDSTTANALTSLTVHSSINSSHSQRRQNSTSSSLELGFSHTAQNSTLSDAELTCIEHDFTIPSTQDGETESVSGVYTLEHGAPPTETSGVYTMNSSEMTGQSSEMAESEKSSHYGIFQPSKNEMIIRNEHDMRTAHSNSDSVDGGNYRGKRLKSEEFRLRSDSNVSTSGSFRGDGSDPTDKKHALLSAEELTDLIVGRGTYPNRKTVSSTLDSDCDYVTLPLPMEGESYIQGHQDTAPTEDHVEDIMNDLLPTDPPAPPQRIDSNGLNHMNLVSLSNIRMRSPPPYNARHEKTGLRGPPVRTTLPNKTAGVVAAVTATIAASTATSTCETHCANMTSTLSKATSPPPLPPSSVSTAVIRRRDPPPYPSTAKPRPTSIASVSAASSTSSSLNNNNTINSSTAIGGSLTSLKASEEVPARFITTRPQISILKAHTSFVNDNPKPSYAAPTNYSPVSSVSGSSNISTPLHHIPSQHHLSHSHSVQNSHYHFGGSQSSLSLSHHHHHAVPTASTPLSAAAVAHAAAAAAAGAGVIPSSIGIPIVPYSLHGAHKSMSSLHQQPPPPPPPYPDMKAAQAAQTRTCVLLPVIKSRQFLPPPPPNLPRQPPPPPPPAQQLATMYTNPLARKQIELYQQQLYSDVDYVIYPIQDPAVSQQEYLDAKQGSILAAMAQTPPPPHPYLAYHHHHHHHSTNAHTASTWADTCKGHAIYRSTPYLPLALSTHSRYASTQNLSDTYVQLPSAYSPLYSGASVASMAASLCSSYEPPPPPPLHPAALAAAAVNTSNLFARSRSDDNILNSLDSLPKVKRLPPPPPPPAPPPYVNRRLKKPPMPMPSEKPPPIPSKPASCLNNTASQLSARSQLPTPPRKSIQPTLNQLNTKRSASHMTKTSSGAQWAGERPKPDSGLGRSSNSSSILAHLQASVAAEANRKAAARATTKKSAAGTASGHSTTLSAAAAAANALDIALLREKSRHLDLPLISALCNDRSLLKQTKVFVNPKQNSATLSSSSSSSASASSAVAAAAAAASAGTTAVATTITTTATSTALTSMAATIISTAAAVNATATVTATIVSNKHASLTMPTTTPTTTTTTTAGLSGGGSKPRKTSISHRHPNDKLPPLPMQQFAEANNYVMDPAVLKHHKSFNSPM